MLDLPSLGEQIAERRKSRRLTQTEVARMARLSRATIDALENGRTGELGFAKISRLLSALGLELTVQPASSQRPTLDDLIEENRHDQSLDKRR